MSLLKKIFPCAIVASMAFCLTGCQSKGKSYYEEAVENLEFMVKDPTSLIIKDGRGILYENGNEVRWGCCIEYNAKNSFGAYVGYDFIYFKYANNTVMPDNNYPHEFDELAKLLNSDDSHVTFEIYHRE